MKRAILLVAVLAGCSPQVDVERIEPFVAAAGYYSILASATSPPPSPAPVQGDACPDCYGRGIVGDQTNMVKCQKCNGTGKLTTTCRSGTCSTRNTVR